MLALLLLLFVVAPLFDLYLLYRIGEAWGFLPTVALVIGTAVLGMAVLKSHVRRAAGALQNPAALIRSPGTTALDGIAAVAGGVLLILPGPITDAVGLLLQVPLLRRLMLRLGRRSIERAVERGTMHVSVMRWGPSGVVVDDEPRAGTPLGLDPSKEIRLPPKT